MSSEQVVYVDKSEMRQGLNVSGNIIQSTDIVKRENIKCIIVAVVQYYSGLIEPIRGEFPSLEHLLCISDLLITGNRPEPPTLTKQNNSWK